MHAPAKRQFLCKCNENCRRHTLCLVRQFEAVSCQNNAFLQAMFSYAEHPKQGFVLGNKKGRRQASLIILYTLYYFKNILSTLLYNLRLYG